jgi:hypothetical protein
MNETPQRPTAYWKVILAAILDFLSAFFVMGQIIAGLTGQTTEHGFQLNGWPALLLFGLIIAYFVIGSRLGGTLWRRILGVRPLAQS